MMECTFLHILGEDFHGFNFVNVLSTPYQTYFEHLMFTRIIKYTQILRITKYM